MPVINEINQIKSNQIIFNTKCLIVALNSPHVYYIRNTNIYIL